MNKSKRIKMLKAMEYIARQLNDKDMFIRNWRIVGIAEGAIEFGDLDAENDPEEVERYIEDDEDFAELMDTFLYMMSHAYTGNTGLFCDGVSTRA